MRPALALIEPDIAGNVGTLLRTAACLGCAIHIVEPCGFAFADRALRRAGMDYAERADWTRHAGIEEFFRAMRRDRRRIILATTTGAQRHVDFHFQPGDVIALGSESSGVPAAFHDTADARIAIPMADGMRSLNVAVSGAIILSEALRQLNGFAT